MLRLNGYPSSRVGLGGEDPIKAYAAIPRRILINDDGWIMSEAEPPLAVSDLKERMVDTYLCSLDCCLLSPRFTRR